MLIYIRRKIYSTKANGALNVQNGFENNTIHLITQMRAIPNDRLFKNTY